MGANDLAHLHGTQRAIGGTGDISQIRPDDQTKAHGLATLGQHGLASLLGVGDARLGENLTPGAQIGQIDHGTVDQPVCGKHLQGHHTPSFKR